MKFTHINPIHEMKLFNEEMKKDEKIKKVRSLLEEAFRTLGIEKTPSNEDTPMRVAKMWVNEQFSSLNETPPYSTLFDSEGYDEEIIVKDIEVATTCEHHLLPIIGTATVSYIPNGHIIGLSKINRIVRHFCKKPQVQERLTVEVANHLKEILNTEDVKVVIEAKHFCVHFRGIEDHHSTTKTSSTHGYFKK
jgi:GTP cyclohydrolase I